MKISIKKISDSVFREVADDFLFCLVVILLLALSSASAGVLKSPRAASSTTPGTQTMAVIAPPPVLTLRWTNSPGYGALVWSGTNLVAPTWVIRQWHAHDSTTAQLPMTNSAEFFRLTAEPDQLPVP